ncbi:MAG TPA: cupin domain-containing protein [Polyangia bacterium]|jgi:mannose-6-phosphate isomerase-like protein (cupin superfamily)
MRKVDKPWGYELIWAETASYVGKVIHINKGERLSLQYHRQKEETLFLQSGLMQLEHFLEDQPRQTAVMKPGDSFHVPPGLRHRMIAVEDCDVFEVSTPFLDDVVRLEDRYGRAPAG